MLATRGDREAWELGDYKSKNEAAKSGELGTSTQVQASTINKMVVRVQKRGTSKERKDMKRGGEEKLGGGKRGEERLDGGEGEERR